RDAGVPEREPRHRLPDAGEHDRRRASHAQGRSVISGRQLSSGALRSGRVMSNGVVIPITPQSKASTVRFKAELRKAIRRNAGGHDVNFLNITAMLDIMTIILVFLLKTLGESSASVPQSK